MASIIWTLGHSTRPLDAFLSLLAESSIERVVDVRRFPGSRRYPHFNREVLEAELQRAGIAYRHVEALGGRRSQRLADSPNTAWRIEHDECSEGTLGGYIGVLRVRPEQGSGRPRILILDGLNGGLENWAEAVAFPVSKAVRSAGRVHETADGVLIE